MHKTMISLMEIDLNLKKSCMFQLIELCVAFAKVKLGHNNLGKVLEPARCLITHYIAKLLQSTNYSLTAWYLHLWNIYYKIKIHNSVTKLNWGLVWINLDLLYEFLSFFHFDGFYFALFHLGFDQIEYLDMILIFTQSIWEIQIFC